MSNETFSFSWTPNLNETATRRLYRVKGRASLEEGGWERPATSAHRFFKVEVDMPTGEPSDVAGRPLPRLTE